jgi:hypothetical protein
MKKNGTTQLMREKIKKQKDSNVYHRQFVEQNKLS